MVVVAVIVVLVTNEEDEATMSLGMILPLKIGLVIVGLIRVRPVLLPPVKVAFSISVPLR